MTVVLVSGCNTSDGTRPAGSPGTDRPKMKAVDTVASATSYSAKQLNRYHHNFIQNGAISMHTVLLNCLIPSGSISVATTCLHPAGL